MLAKSSKNTSKGVHAHSLQFYEKQLSLQTLFKEFAYMLGRPSSRETVQRLRL